MSPAAIPQWTATGVLPPVNAAQPVSPDRSPYIVSLTDFVLRFGSTQERRAVLDGFLRYRAALHGSGLGVGFQWLDGSFLEQIETLEGRPPNDVDVVTFYQLPNGVSQRDFLAASAPLFDNVAVKQVYHVDAYFVNLSTPPERLTRQSAYWYSVWSHRRDQLWKGFVELDFAPTDDVAAAALLARLNAGGPP